MKIPLLIAVPSVTSLIRSRVCFVHFESSKLTEYLEKKSFVYCIKGM